jgi:hypothetical protein
VLHRPEARDLTGELRILNGELAIVVTGPVGVDSVMFLTVEGDRITAMHQISNPEKLAAL